MGVHPSVVVALVLCLIRVAGILLLLLLLLGVALRLGQDGRHDGLLGSRLEEWYLYNARGNCGW